MPNYDVYLFPSADVVYDVILHEAAAGFNQVEVTGEIALSGSLRLAVVHNLAGTLVPNSSLTAQLIPALTGGVSPAGVLRLGVNRALAGQIAPSGNVDQFTVGAQEGTIALGGVLRLRVSKALTGEITLNSDLMAGLLISRTLVGEISFSSELDMAVLEPPVEEIYTGQIALSGVVLLARIWASLRDEATTVLIVYDMSTTGLILTEDVVACSIVEKSAILEIEDQSDVGLDVESVLVEI